jgi:hypothetical protein
MWHSGGKWGKVENYGESYYMSDCREDIKERGVDVAVCHSVFRGQVPCHMAGTIVSQQSQPVTTTSQNT